VYNTSESSPRRSGLAQAFGWMTLPLALWFVACGPSAADGQAAIEKGIKERNQAEFKDCPLELLEFKKVAGQAYEASYTAEYRVTLAFMTPCHELKCGNRKVDAFMKKYNSKPVNDASTGCATTPIPAASQLVETWKASFLKYPDGWHVLAVP
jgi:hypothetical protein